MAPKTMNLLLIIVLVASNAIVVALAAAKPKKPLLPAEWTTAKKIKAAMDAKTRKAFDGVEAAAPAADNKQKEAANLAVFQQELLIDIALQKATQSGDESNYVSVAAAYDKAADAVIAAPPADKRRTMESAFGAVVAPDPTKCPAVDGTFCEAFFKMDKAMKEVMTAAGDTPAKKKEIMEAILKPRLAADAVINKAYAEGDRKRIDEVVAAYGKAADAVVAAAPPEKLRVMEETFKAVTATAAAAGAQKKLNKV